VRVIDVGEKTFLRDFNLAHIDGNELNPDKIYMKLDTQIIHNTTSVNNTNGIMIDKRSAKVLSHWFRHAAELMDEWYKEDNGVKE
jgi:hypothetical protein